MLRYENFSTTLLSKLQSILASADMKKRAGFLFLSAAITSTFYANSGFAQTSPQVADSVHELDLKRGDKEIEFKFGTLDQRQQGRTSDAHIGFGYAVTLN